MWLKPRCALDVWNDLHDHLLRNYSWGIFNEIVKRAQGSVTISKYGQQQITTTNNEQALLPLLFGRAGAEKQGLDVYIK